MDKPEVYIVSSKHTVEGEANYNLSLTASGLLRARFRLEEALISCLGDVNFYSDGVTKDKASEINNLTDLRSSQLVNVIKEQLGTDAIDPRFVKGMAFDTFLGLVDRDNYKIEHACLVALLTYLKAVDYKVLVQETEANNRGQMTNDERDEIINTNISKTNNPNNILFIGQDHLLSSLTSNDKLKSYRLEIGVEENTIHVVRGRVPKKLVEAMCNFQRLQIEENPHHPLDIRINYV